MKIKNLLFQFVLTLLPILSIAQSATLKGVILDQNNIPIPDVSVTVGELGTSSNENGFFLIKIPANQDITVQFTHISHQRISKTVPVNSNRIFFLAIFHNLQVTEANYRNTTCSVQSCASAKKRGAFFNTGKS